jgi:hypothetical protein
MKFLPFSNSVEGFFRKYSVAFTLVVMFQGIFGRVSAIDMPKRMEKVASNMYFRIFTLFAIAFTATTDVEVSVVSVVMFIALLNILRTKEERAAKKGNLL